MSKSFCRLLFVHSIIEWITPLSLIVIQMYGYLEKLVRIDMWMYLHGKTGFKKHTRVRVCCCHCAVLDPEGDEPKKTKEEIYAKQTMSRGCVKFIFRDFCFWLTCKYCGGRACRLCRRCFRQHAKNVEEIVKEE